jgi:UDP-glucose 4-epimerase
VESLKANFPMFVTLRDCRLPRDSIEDLLRQEKPDALIHCVGAPTVSYSQQNPLADFQNTVVTTAHVLDNISRCSPRTRFVLVSSAAVYGDRGESLLEEEIDVCPVSTYGYHKWLAEILVKRSCLIYRVPSLVVRPFSVYGPGLRKQVLFDICRKLVSMESRIVLKGTGQESRDFIHGDDLAASIRHLIATDTHGVVNVGTGVGTTIKSLSRDVAALINPSAEVTFDQQRIPFDPASLVADTTRAHELGLSHTVNLATGLRAYCEWFLRSKIE